MSPSARTTASRLDGWSESIEAAVRTLPNDPRCDHDFYLAMLEVNAGNGGRTVIVERGGRPTAVVGLRRDGRLRWVNALNWRIPGVVAASEGDVLEAIAAIPAEVYLAWWRMPAPPRSSAVRSATETPVHVLDVVDRYEYWHTSRVWKTIRSARTKCAELDIVIDEPGAAEWVIRSAATKWEGPGGSTSASTELALEAARQLSARHRFMTVLLRDGDRPLAGSTNILDGDTVVGAGLFRDDSVGPLPTGIRVLDEAFEYAEREGLARVDMGGGFAYKSRWAPVHGARYDVITAPPLIYAARRAASRLSSRIRRRDGHTRTAGVEQ